MGETSFFLGDRDNVVPHTRIYLLDEVLLLICAVPVSYTHLDVYKRQDDAS